MKTARFILRDKEFEVNAGMTVYHALEKIGVDETSVIPTREGELITEDEIVRPGDIIKLVAIISGG